MFFTEKMNKARLILLNIGDKKDWVYTVFFLIILLFYLFQQFSRGTQKNLLNKSNLLSSYNEQLKINQTSPELDSTIRLKERTKLIHAIESKIVGYLYQIPDYSYMNSLETYLKYAPELLQQIPSVVPLEKSHYYVSSNYGYRKHPISNKKKIHKGIDLAATRNSPVYAAASGTVQEVIKDNKGYGTHIIIKHRFGFQTLYGHLNKVLVSKGQAIKQHELIAAVGNTGATTGYHLHYEVIKNNLKIDPKESMNLKRKTYLNLLHVKSDTTKLNAMKI